MAATLTATKNPVGVWGETGTNTTTISWDTGSAQRGRVYMVATPRSIPQKAALFAGNPATGDRNGSRALSVKVGSTYTLILRQANNSAVLATLVVKVVDASDQAAAQATAAILLQRSNPTQAIYSLSVLAGIDTVRVLFSTVQPTIPAVRVEALDGSLVTATLAISGGLHTEHDALLGGASALDLNTTFKLKIIASGHDFRGGPYDAVATAQFTTGSRFAIVNFDTINVWRDGDSGGDGEFVFTFGAGDPVDLSNLGEPWPDNYYGDINDDDPPVSVDRSIDIPLAPRNLWVGVVGRDDDHTIFEIGTGRVGPRRPFFHGVPDSSSQDYGWADESYVTGVFDISDLVGGGTVPMVLTTGNFGVAFTVNGSIAVQTRPGISPVIRSLSTMSKETSDIAALVKAGVFGGLTPKGGKPGNRRGQLVARGADGAVYRSMPNTERWTPRDESWALAAPAVEGPVIAVAAEKNRLAFFALDPQGAVLRADVVGERSAAAWRKLTPRSKDGRFTGALAAVTQAKSIELLAHDDAGAMFHLTLPLKGGRPESDWRRIGEGLQGEFQTVSLGKDAFAVFALGRNGEVMHRIHRNGHWRKDGWQVIAGASGVLLGAAGAGSGSVQSDESEPMGVALAVIGEDLKLHTLHWRDYPAKQPERWVAHGDFQSWLVRPMKAKPVPRRRALSIRSE